MAAGARHAGRARDRRELAAGTAVREPYVEHTALANPHATLHYLRPKAGAPPFPRATDELPKEALEIKPHPHGVELGALMLMAAESKSRDVQGFLQTAFSRVSAAVARRHREGGGAQGAGAAARPRRGPGPGGEAAQGHRRDADHGAADELPLAHRRRAHEARARLLPQRHRDRGAGGGEQLDLDQAGKKRASKRRRPPRPQAPVVPDAPPEEGSRRSRATTTSSPR